MHDGYYGMRRIPCASEFLHYVHGHNDATALEEWSIVPNVLHVHYEDYANNHMQENVLAFLELEQIVQQEDGDGLVFLPNKAYIEMFFSPKQQKAKEPLLFEELSTNVLQHLQLHFGNSTAELT